MGEYSPILVYALGGLCEVGKNTYCIESDDSLLIIDAGVMFPGPDFPGVDYVIPDYTKLKSSRQKIRALIITHGHEDHIGAIPFLLQNVHIPVIYAPRLAAALIRNKLVEHRIREEVTIVEYDENSVLKIAEFNVSFFYVTHSIPDAFGIVVDTPQGRIVHTGDFKIDITPVGHDIELTKIAKIGSEGVELLLSDSTNAEIEGYTPSEKNVLSSIQEIFDNTQGRLVFSTFSSNLSRIQQICQTAVEHNRRIVIVGRSMEKVVQIARDYGYIKIPDISIIGPQNIREYKNSEICVLCTGSQGEQNAALGRIARGDHPDFRIIPGDTVVFSSSAIPGNGELISRLVNELSRKGANVLLNSMIYAVHSSGHPSKQELRIMLKLINPRFFMPIHGEYRMLKLHGQIAESLGMSKNNIFILNNGDSISLLKHQISYGPHFPADNIYIDGRDINGLNSSVLKDRNQIQQDGVISLIVGIDSKKGEIIVAPKCITKAFSPIPGLEKKIEDIVNIALLKILPHKPSFNDIKTTIRNEINRYIERKVERNPAIIPVVMDKN